MSGGTIAVSGALALSGAGSIGLYNPAATLSAGSLSQTGGILGMSGGTLGVSGLASFTGGTDVLYANATLDAGALQVGSSGAAQTLTVNGAVLSVSGTATVASGSTLSMYGGSLNAQGGLVVSGTISGAGTLGGPISGSGTIYAQSGTLDLTGNFTGGPTFNIASDADLKFDGTVTVSFVPNLVDVTQVLEVGAQGSLTFSGGISGGTAFTTKLDGGTITDPNGYRIGAYGVVEGFGTVNGTEFGFGNSRGQAIHATGGTLILNGDLYNGDRVDVAAGSIFSLNGTVQSAVPFSFLSAASGTLLLETAAARQSFETNGTIGNMAVGGSPSMPTDILDLADLLPGSITSASIANGNTIDLFNGSVLTNHFALASSVGSAVVHWTSDGTTGTDIFLGTT
jgi:hypothetical protein